MFNLRSLRQLGLTLVLLLGVGAWRVVAQEATPVPETAATPAADTASATPPAAWDAAKQGDEDGITNADFITKFDGTLKNDKGEAINKEAPAMNSGDTAWMLISAALVLFMTPGLALFYAGMARSKNVLNVLMQSFIAMSIVTVVWVVVGYSLAFAPGNDFIGGTQFLMLGGVGQTTFSLNGTGYTIPHQVYMAFQMMFAVITPALISGAIVERMKFSSYCLFIALWSLFVYSPMAHMVWGAGGFLFKKGALDFAGGTVIHITSGISALTLAFILGKRRLSSFDDTRPHSLPITLIGTGILWFGWFGFNAGSAGASGGLAGSALTVTHIAAAVAGLVWSMIEWVHVKKPTALGFASGAVAGLVAITPASGFVDAKSAIVIGAVVPFLSYGVIQLKNKLGKYDDTLDVFAVHCCGGIWGALATGIFASEKVNAVVTASIKPEDGGRMHLITAQLFSIGMALVLGIVVTSLIAIVLKATIGLQVSANEEEAGLDVTQHDEVGYVLNAGGSANTGH
jgi:ammonium transporter, Amt family